MSINRWIDKDDVVHIYGVEYYLAIKKNEILSFTATGHYAKLHKSYRERQTLYDIAYMWNLKNTTS